MKRVKLFVILALAMLLFAACSTAEYCNCGCSEEKVDAKESFFVKKELYEVYLLICFAV